MHVIDHWLTTLPPLLVYLLVAAVILTESMGVPLPGEVTLMSAALLSAKADSPISPLGVALAVSFGAIVGDSIGYTIGRRGGRPLLERLGRRFPKHLGPEHLAKAEQTFARWGVWAVFFGRFIALLRILAGPLAGALRVPYPKFLAANASGGLTWAFGTTYVVYFVGQKAEKYMQGFGWIALVLALICGGATTMVIKKRATRAAKANGEKVNGEPDDQPKEPDSTISITP